jgi:hypothetical protein
MSKTIHMASAISRDAGHVIPLCADFPRFVSAWTHRPREVTCAKCRERIALPGVLGGLARDNPARRSFRAKAQRPQSSI